MNSSRQAARFAASNTTGRAFSGDSTRISSPVCVVLMARMEGSPFSSDARRSTQAVSDAPTVSEMMSPPSPAFSSLGDPSALMRPPSMMARRSHNRSASSR